MTDMDDTVFEALDADLEEFRRYLRVRLRRALRESLGPGAGGPAFHLVETLVARGPASPADLASALEVRSSTMAAHLDRLEELGWVRRQAAATNRVQVAVTPAGRQAFEHYVAVRRAVLVETLRPLSAARVRDLAATLHICVEAQRQAANRGGEPR